MIESTSSWTNASGSKPNFFTANGTIAPKKGAPGMSGCLRQPCVQPPGDPLPGHPPTLAACSITRLLSVTRTDRVEKIPLAAGGDPVRVATAGIQIRAGCFQGDLRGELGEEVLDLERA